MKKLRATIDPLQEKGKINRELYGQFIEQAGRIVYGGLFVGKDSPIPNEDGVRLDVIQAYRDIQVPLLHWPGGGVADSYHWMDGVGPQEERKPLINRWTHQVEDNSFGTHEFFNLCEALGCEPYLVFNVGSATVRETASWLEYITFDGDTEMTRLRKKNGREKPWRLKYICMGNEWWFYETAQGYAEDYRRYSQFAREYGDNKLVRLLRGPQHFSYEHTDQLAGLVEPGSFDAMTLYQIIPSVPEGGGQSMQGGPIVSGGSVEFTREEYYAALQNALKIDGSIPRHLGILTRRTGNQGVKLAIDEWGTWYRQEKPEELWSMHMTMRDALIAAAVLNIYNQRSKDLLLCSLCMSINALCSILETKGDQLVKTPVYYVFRMYQGHQDAVLVHSFVEEDTVSFQGQELPCVSCSVSKKGETLLATLVNCSLERDYALEIELPHWSCRQCEGEILTGEIHSRNTFDAPCAVLPQAFTDFQIEDGRLRLTLPRASVVSLTLAP